MGGVCYELVYDLDDPVWHHILFRDQYGLLGWNGCCFTDCYFDECGVLEHEAPKARLDAMNPVEEYYLLHKKMEPVVETDHDS